MPGGSAKRGRRAVGPEEPAGGLPPKRRRGLAWFIHRQRSPQDVKEFIKLKNRARALRGVEMAGKLTGTTTCKIGAWVKHR